MDAITFYIDIGTLFDPVYTGVANVNYQIAKWYRTHQRERSRFFRGRQVIHPAIVDALLERKNGKGLPELFNRGRVSTAMLSRSLRETGHTISVGIFSNVKMIEGVFDYEAQVMHDITFLLTPEFHQSENIAHHGLTVESNVASSDLLICVSRHTLEDVALYLQVPRTKMMVAHLGVDEAPEASPMGDVEPFVLILGTVEPRKNVGLILDTLRKRPDFLKTWRFVFIGIDGWGQSFDAMLAEAGLAKVGRGRILRLGYVSEPAKRALLRNARLLLYPSFYEGFGLPVLEALQAGCPTIASYSSSIVEVGGDVVRYVDPHSVKDLEAALEEARVGQAPWLSSPERLKARAAGFTWDKFCSSIHGRIVADLSGARWPEACS